MRAWGRGALPINKMSSPSSFGRRFVLYVEPCRCRVRVMGKKKKKIRKGQLFKSTRLRVRTRWHIVSNDWLWFEYRIYMLIILQIIFEFWEATGQVLFLMRHIVNRKKQNKMKNASQSTNPAHKSLRQRQLSVGWEPGDEVHFQKTKCPRPVHLGADLCCTWNRVIDE